MNVNVCLACGYPIPNLIIEGGKYKFRCNSCLCETKEQQSFDVAVELWNDGRIYISDPEFFWKRFDNKFNK